MLEQAKVPEPDALSRNTEHSVIISQAVLQKAKECQVIWQDGWMEVIALKW